MRSTVVLWMSTLELIERHPMLAGACFAGKAACMAALRAELDPECVAGGIWVPMCLYPGHLDTELFDYRGWEFQPVYAAGGDMVAAIVRQARGG